MLLELKDICFTRDNKKILNNINLQIEPEKFIAITGPNGSGKSTLAKIIMGIEEQDSGQVILDGLMPGIYYIKEVQAPNGYSIDSELKKVEIKLNQEISLKIKNNKIIIKQEEPQQPIVEIPKLPVTGM